MEQKKYSVEIDVIIGDEVLTTYLSVEASTQEEAYKKAVQIVNTTTDIRIERKPKEEL